MREKLEDLYLRTFVFDDMEAVSRCPRARMPQHSRSLLPQNWRGENCATVVSPYVDADRRDVVCQKIADFVAAARACVQQQQQQQYRGGGG